MVVVAVVGVKEVVVMLVEEEVVGVEDSVILPDRFELDSLGVLTVVTLLF